MSESPNTSRVALSLPKQFIAFSIVGTIGFIVDAGTLHLLLATSGLGFYLGRLFSYLTAASVTWFLNRRFTFKDRRKSGRARQWGRFLIVNTSGGIVNYCIYSLLVFGYPFFQEWPVVAVAIGSLAGLVVNFTASKYLVFR